jgi:predicted nucleic-acid-binding Zn-ribbon protein
MMVKYVKVCPKCGSTEIGQETDRIGVGNDNSKLAKTDYCKDCGFGLRGYPAQISDASRESKPSFTNTFVEVREDKLEEFRKRIKEEQDADDELSKRESPFVQGEWKRKRQI